MAIISVFTVHANAQTDSTKYTFSVSAYLETYYAFDFANPADHNRPGFVYSHNRHNEVNLNLGFIKAACSTGKARANLALMAGTYVNANLAAEPGVLRNIFEANAGVKISKKHNLWADAGIFTSHIGFESAIGKNCWNVTRSILADNSPYYESGLKVSYSSAQERWLVAGLLLNGWQRIQRVNGNNTPAFGHQLTFKPNSKITLNSSSFAGSDTPDSLRLMRYFHNFYGSFKLSGKFGLILGFDVGAQQMAKNSNAYHSWYAPVAILRYTPDHRFSIAVRGEYYADEYGVIIHNVKPNGFLTYGYSANLDYQITNNMIWRIEGRGFESKDEIFMWKNKPDTHNYFLTSALAISF